MLPKHGRILQADVTQMQPVLQQGARPVQQGFRLGVSRFSEVQKYLLMRLQLLADLLESLHRLAIWLPGCQLDCQIDFRLHASLHRLGRGLPGPQHHLQFLSPPAGELEG